MGLFKNQTKKQNTNQIVQTDEKEIAAAIAVALRLFSYKTITMEETIITIQKVMRPYSPWNSKIYNMKQMPQRIPNRRMK
jgi:hypothetical protein